MSEPGNNESNVPEVQAHKIQAAHQATHALQVKRFHHILQSDAARHKIKLGRRLSSIKAPVAVASIAQRHDAQSSDQPLPTDDRDAVASFHIVIENETSPCFLNLAVDEPTPDCECGFPAQLRQRFVYGGTIEPTVVDADGEVVAPSAASQNLIFCCADKECMFFQVVGGSESDELSIPIQRPNPSRP